MAFRPPLDFFAALAVAVPGAVPTPVPGTVVEGIRGPIDATGGHVAYSRPEGGEYRLVVDGIDAPVAAEEVPFDVDLGSDARGRLTAVWSTDAGIRALDVDSGRARTVPGARGFAPSVSRGRLIFATKGAKRDALAITPLAGGRPRPLPIPSPTRAGCTTEECDTLAISGTEIAGGVLAFTAMEEGIPEFSSAQLWYTRVGSAPRLAARQGGSINQGTELFAPSIGSRWVTAGLTHVGDDGGPGPGEYSRLVRVSPSRGLVERATVADVPDRDNARGETEGTPVRALQGLGVSSAGTFVTACSTTLEEEVDGTTDCRLSLEPEPRWRRVTGKRFR